MRPQLPALDTFGRWARILVVLRRFRFGVLAARKMRPDPLRAVRRVRCPFFPGEFEAVEATGEVGVVEAESRPAPVEAGPRRCGRPQIRGPRCKRRAGNRAASQESAAPTAKAFKERKQANSPQTPPSAAASQTTGCCCGCRCLLELVPETEHGAAGSPSGGGDEIAGNL